MRDHQSIASPPPETTALARCAGGVDRAVDQPGAAAPDTSESPTFAEQLTRAERARQGRLRSLWQMTPAQRVAAMRRGELTYEQLAAWSARHPEQVPIADDEFEWIIAKTPEACE